jgi:hypothetical protein
VTSSDWLWLPNPDDSQTGSIQYRGFVLEFLRDSALDAYNYFDNPSEAVPALHQHQFGTTVGGPVHLGSWYDGRDNAFFYFSYEGQRIQRSVTQTFSVPPLSLRTGNVAGGASRTSFLRAGRHPMAAIGSQRRPHIVGNCPVRKLNSTSSAIVAGDNREGLS